MRDIYGIKGIGASQVTNVNTRKIHIHIFRKRGSWKVYLIIPYVLSARESSCASKEYEKNIGEGVRALEEAGE